MVSYPVNTMESAPQASKPVLEQLQKAFGFIPNLVGAVLNSPVLINSLVGLFQTVHGGSFTEAEVQTLLLTDAVTNSCAWAVALHTALALKEGLDPADVEAIRQRQLPKNKRYAALSRLARARIEQRGHVGNEELTAFIEAGFTPALALEVIAAVAASTITNYAGSLTDPPLEAQFQEYQWRG